MLFHVFMQHLLFEHLLLPGTVLGTGNTKVNKTHSLPSRTVQCKWSGDKDMVPHGQCENGAFLVLPAHGLGAEPHQPWETRHLL